mmetsp:Transcript_8242/g.34979  ORF Transcript_8242/g.34979 Transcript_8242/m.34979 type:complete len:89 (+) Transcript_8242:1-267(+)
MSTPPLAICAGRRALVWFEEEAEPKRSRRERGQRDAPTEKKSFFLRSFSPSERRKEGSGGVGSEKKTRVFETRGEFPAILANRALRRV